MPRFYQTDEAEKSDVDVSDKQEKDIKYWKIFLVVVFFYYFISCGVERIYQPMAFTFGKSANNVISLIFYKMNRERKILKKQGHVMADKCASLDSEFVYERFK